MRFRKVLSLFVILISSVLVCASTGCHRHKKAAAQAALVPIRLQLDSYPRPEYGGFFAAQLQGYYKAEGLEVTLLPLPQDGNVAQLVSTSKADIGLGSSDQILEWNSNGLPLIAVAATMQHDPQAVMVHSDSSVRAFKDLEGKTIAAQSDALWLKYITRQYNLKNVRAIPTAPSIANFLADPNYVEQIVVTSEPFFARQGGASVRTILISSSGYDPYRVQFTSRSFAEQHPDIVAKFVRATIRGWQEYLRDPVVTNAQLVHLNRVLNPAQEAYTAEALLAGGFVAGDNASNPQTGHMTAARWDATYKQLKDLGVIQTPIDPATAYSLKFVP